MKEYFPETSQNDKLAKDTVFMITILWLILGLENLKAKRVEKIKIAGIPLLVGTMNPRSLAFTTRNIDFVNWLEKIRIDVLGLVKLQ